MGDDSQKRLIPRQAPGSGLDQVRGGGMIKDVLAKLAEKIAACGVDQVAGEKTGAAMG